MYFSVMFFRLARSIRPLLAIVSLSAGVLACPGLLRAEPLKIMGSSIVMPPVNDAIKELHRAQPDLDIEVSSMGGVPAALSSLGGGALRIAMLARHVGPDDRASFPELKLVEFPVGRQVAALCVSVDVWKSGVRQLSADQIRGIYEGRTKNWKELGGNDQAITFYNWDEGFGMWELLATWLYGDSSKAPKGKFSAIGSNEEARNAIEFIQGGIAVMSPKNTMEGFSYPLALLVDKKPVAPVAENVASGAYPMVRPMVLVVDDKPTGIMTGVIDYIRGPQGQKSFQKLGFFAEGELGNVGSIKSAE